MTDEDHDGAVGFLDRDRMAQAIIVRNARGRHFVAGMGAGSQHDGKTDKRSRHAEDAIAIDGCFGCHRFVLVPPQSVIKP